MHLFSAADGPAVLPDSAVPRVLPIPLVLDSHVVALLNLLLRQEPARPVLLDGSGVRRVCPVAALLLASVLRQREASAGPVRIVRLPYAERRRFEKHPLAEYLAVEEAAAGATGPGPACP